MGNTHILQIDVQTTDDRLFPDRREDGLFNRHHPFTALLESAYQEFCRRDRYTPIMLESLTMEMLVTLHRSEQKPPEKVQHSQWLERAREMVHEEISENLTLDRIASEVGVHPAHLAKAFRRQFATSVGEYIRRLRILKACHLLETSESGLGWVAMETGFLDQSHFTKTFKRYTGQTPLTYRKLHPHQKKHVIDHVQSKFFR